MLDFDSWMAANCNPPANYSFGQYANYLSGWRNSLPWAYKGMSTAFDYWAESKWERCPDAEKLKTTWKGALALQSAQIMEETPDYYWKDKPVESCADFLLTVPETLEALIVMALNNQTHEELERNMQNFKKHIEAIQQGKTPPAIEPPDNIQTNDVESL